MEILIIIVCFASLLLLNVPIAVCIGMAALVSIFAIGDLPTTYLVAQRMANGIASFPLLAIPFFVLSGVLMGEGGMARRLVDFASAVMGRLPGGLAYVNTLTCMLFGAIAGSAAAAVSSVGGFMLPEMERKNYGRGFSVAVTTTSATTGLLIPPSNVMIVYAVVAGNVSVAALFMAGVLPGILIGLLIMGSSFFYLSRRNLSPETNAASFKRIATTFLSALPSLLLIIIVLGGIFGGVFSATEASAVAVAYALLLTMVFYREISTKQLPDIILRAAKMTSVVMLLIGASQAMSWSLTYLQVPQTVSQAMLAISDNPIVILLIINVMLLIVGVFMDMTPAILIFAPIFLPVMQHIGVDPVHFGVIMIANLCIGLCTPPVGACLFIGCSVGNTTLASVFRPLLPIFGAMVVGLLIITYVPEISLWLPRLMGL
ncbi:MAG: hypothetical protein E1N59_2362 [Puniceicoccaceae bacterium 5H]|nr:MAG: hypothetical protein E1N59_2362 [Puniceicoccaceae bacterium 5H]